jgi:hypothetical protein
MTRYTAPIDPIDYLIIGHVTQDVVENGFSLGGTVTFSALTARAMGLRVGILTACKEDLDLSPLNGIAIAAVESNVNTTFQNIPTPAGRIQFLHHQADIIEPGMVPETWLKTPIVHLGPVAQEISPNMVRAFPETFIGLTPQGWLRQWDNSGRVSLSSWPESRFILENASAAVLSIEDVGGDEKLIEDMLTSIRILVVTEGAEGGRLYWNGDVRRFRPPQKYDGESTGAGDIFAAAFFFRLKNTHDPWEAARFATRLAARSITRLRFDKIPTPDEVRGEMIEIISDN